MFALSGSAEIPLLAADTEQRRWIVSFAATIAQTRLIARELVAKLTTLFRKSMQVRNEGRPTNIIAPKELLGIEANEKRLRVLAAQLAMYFLAKELEYGGSPDLTKSFNPTPANIGKCSYETFEVILRAFLNKITSVEKIDMLMQKFRDSIAPSCNIYINLYSENNNCALWRSIRPSPVCKRVTKLDENRSDDPQAISSGNPTRHPSENRSSMVLPKVTKPNQNADTVSARRGSEDKCVETSMKLATSEQKDKVTQTSQDDAVSLSASANHNASHTNKNSSGLRYPGLKFFSSPSKLAAKLEPKTIENTNMCPRADSSRPPVPSQCLKFPLSTTPFSPNQNASSSRHDDSQNTAPSKVSNILLSKSASRENNNIFDALKVTNNKHVSDGAYDKSVERQTSRKDAHNPQSNSQRVLDLKSYRQMVSDNNKEIRQDCNNAGQSSFDKTINHETAHTSSRSSANVATQHHKTGNNSSRIQPHSKISNTRQPSSQNDLNVSTMKTHNKHQQISQNASHSTRKTNDKRQNSDQSRSSSTVKTNSNYQRSRQDASQSMIKTKDSHHSNNPHRNKSASKIDCNLQQSHNRSDQTSINVNGMDQSSKQHTTHSARKANHNPPLDSHHTIRSTSQLDSQHKSPSAGQGNDRHQQSTKNTNQSACKTSENQQAINRNSKQSIHRSTKQTYTESHINNHVSSSKRSQPLTMDTHQQASRIAKEPFTDNSLIMKRHHRTTTDNESCPSKRSKSSHSGDSSVNAGTNHEIFTSSEITIPAVEITVSGTTTIIHETTSNTTSTRPSTRPEIFDKQLSADDHPVLQLCACETTREQIDDDNLTAEGFISSSGTSQALSKTFITIISLPSDVGSNSLPAEISNKSLSPDVATGTENPFDVTAEPATTHSNIESIDSVNDSSNVLQMPPLIRIDQISNFHMDADNERTEVRQSLSVPCPPSQTQIRKRNHSEGEISEAKRLKIDEAMRIIGTLMQRGLSDSEPSRAEVSVDGHVIPERCPTLLSLLTEPTMPQNDTNEINYDFCSENRSFTRSEERPHVTIFEIAPIPGYESPNPYTEPISNTSTANSLSDGGDVTGNAVYTSPTADIENGCGTSPPTATKQKGDAEISDNFYNYASSRPSSTVNEGDSLFIEGSCRQCETQTSFNFNHFTACHQDNSAPAVEKDYTHDPDILSSMLSESYIDIDLLRYTKVQHIVETAVREAETIKESRARQTSDHQLQHDAPRCNAALASSTDEIAGGGGDGCVGGMAFSQHDRLTILELARQTTLDNQEFSLVRFNDQEEEQQHTVTAECRSWESTPNRDAHPVGEFGTVESPQPPVHTRYDNRCQIPAGNKISRPAGAVCTSGRCACGDPNCNRVFSEVSDEKGSYVAKSVKVDQAIKRHDYDYKRRKRMEIKQNQLTEQTRQQDTIGQQQREEQRQLQIQHDPAQRFLQPNSKQLLQPNTQNDRYGQLILQNRLQQQQPGLLRQRQEANQANIQQHAIQTQQQMQSQLIPPHPQQQMPTRIDPEQHQPIQPAMSSYCQQQQHLLQHHQREHSLQYQSAKRVIPEQHPSQHQSMAMESMPGNQQQSMQRMHRTSDYQQMLHERQLIQQNEQLKRRRGQQSHVKGYGSSSYVPPAYPSAQRQQACYVPPPPAGQRSIIAMQTESNPASKRAAAAAESQLRNYASATPHNTLNVGLPTSMPTDNGQDLRMNSLRHLNAIMARTNPHNSQRQRMEYEHRYNAASRQCGSVDGRAPSSNGGVYGATMAGMHYEDNALQCGLVNGQTAMASAAGHYYHTLASSAHRGLAQNLPPQYSPSGCDLPISNDLPPDRRMMPGLLPLPIGSR